MKLCLNCMELYEGEYDVCPYCGYSGGESNGSRLLSCGYQLANRYIIGNVLSQDEKSATYLAWDRTLNMKVDVVEYRPEHSGNMNGDIIEYRPEHSEKNDVTADIRSFVNRAAALAQFNDNPNFITIYSIIKERGTAYIIKEHLEGQTLREYTSKFAGRRSRKKATAILRKLIAILQQLNEAGFGHNGVNPDNIILDEKGEPKLTVIGTSTEEALTLPDWLQDIARSGVRIRKRVDISTPEKLLRILRSKEERISIILILVILLVAYVGYFAIQNGIWTIKGGEVLSYCISENDDRKIAIAEVKNLTSKKPISYVNLGDESWRTVDENDEVDELTTDLSIHCYIPPGETGLAVEMYEVSEDYRVEYEIIKPFTYDLENTVTIREKYTGYVNPEVKAEGGRVVLYNENPFKIPRGYIVSINRDENGKIISCDAANVYEEICSNELNSGRNVCNISLKYDWNSELIFIPNYDELTETVYMFEGLSELTGMEIFY